MKTIAVIELKPIKLKRQRPTEIIGGYLKLFENHIEYYLEFRAEELKEEIRSEDEVMLKSEDSWENNLTYFIATAKRECISGIEMQWLPAARVFRTSIFIMGFANDLCVYYKTRTEALVLVDKINEYLYQTESLTQTL